MEKLLLQLKYPDLLENYITPENIDSCLDSIDIVPNI